jgi:predicted permease
MRNRLFRPGGVCTAPAVGPRGPGLAGDLARDVRHAVRQVRRSPAFALLAMLCLGLGIGVNTAIFGVINAVLLRPMPVTEPAQLVLVSRGETAPFSYPDYREVQKRTHVLSGLTATVPMESDLDVDGESAFVVAEAVSPNYAAAIGIIPSVGRWFVDERDPVAVISHAVWERRFNLSPQVIGRVIRSESQSYTVVGVAPREFTGTFAPMRTDLWVPIQSRPRLAAQLEAGENRRMLALFGRLQRGATPAQASAELNAIDAQLRREQGGTADRPAPVVAQRVRGVPNPGSQRVLQTLATLMAAVVGLVLLIACVNVGNLLLVRGALRQREFGVRAALGASRFRLLRQLLTESLVLGVGGGICGVTLAVWTNRLLEMTFPAFVQAFTLHVDLSLDWNAVVFAAIVSVITTALCGLLPAWQTSQSRGLMAFKGEIGGGTPRRRPLGLVAQVVMSWVLLFLAGSFLQALLRLQATDPGFEVAGRLYAYLWIPTPPFTPESGREFYAHALDRVRALPGVRTAALASSLPLMPAGSDCAALPAGPQIPITTAAVDTGYFGTLGIGLVAGREFAATDSPTAAPAAVVVNETLARRLWPDRPAIGEHLLVGCKAAQPAVVIGLAADSVIRAVGETPQPHLYRRLGPEHMGLLTTILLHTSTDPAAMVQPVRRTLADLRQGVRLYTVEPLAVHVEQSYAQVRWLAEVLTGFGVLALLLAAVGVYGTIAYRVTLRTQEIGVRMALGASRTDVFREVVTYGLGIVLIGVAIGELLTAGFTTVAGAMLSGIRPTDLSTHVAAALIWIVVALAACYLPAARAARVDPLTALRHE